MIACCCFNVEDKLRNRICKLSLYLCQSRISRNVDWTSHASEPRHVTIDYPPKLALALTEINLRSLPGTTSCTLDVFPGPLGLLSGR